MGVGQWGKPEAARACAELCFHDLEIHLISFSLFLSLSLSFSVFSLFFFFLVIFILAGVTSRVVTFQGMGLTLKTPYSRGHTHLYFLQVYFSVVLCFFFQPYLVMFLFSFFALSSSIAI